MSRFADISQETYSWSAAGVLQRLVDGLGYRLYWATDGLRDGDLDADPGHEHMTIRDLLVHITRLARFVAQADVDAAATTANPRHEALAAIAHLRETLDQDLDDGRALRLRDHDWPHAVNGPLADALTHVGQIATIRRLLGNPVPAHNRFTGKPA